MLSRQFLVFCTIGGLSALIDVGVMQILIYGGIHYGLAASLGFIISLIFNYTCQSKLTFKASTSFSTIMKFSCLVVMNYLITMVSVILSQKIFGNPLIGKIFSLPMIAVNSFLWSRYWVFNRP